MTSPADSNGNGQAPPRVILASGSATRAALLRASGVPLAAAVPPAVDESALKQSLQREEAPPDDIARALAELKALRVSRKEPGAMVIGADQVLVCEGMLFDKPADRAAAAAQLRALRGKRHELMSAAAAAKDSAIIWRGFATARLMMRPFSDAFIESYLDQAGEAALQSVGAYRFEAEGAQLFSAVSGDPYVIMGLPLLPLLDFLRAHRILPA